MYFEIVFELYWVIKLKTHMKSGKLKPVFFFLNNYITFILVREAVFENFEGGKVIELDLYTSNLSWLKIGKKI